MALSERVKGVALTYIFMVLRNGVAILIIPFIIANVGVGHYGVYSLVASIIGYLIVMELGLSNTSVRFLAKFWVSGDREAEAIAFGKITLLYAFVTLLSVLVATLFYGYLDVFFQDSLTPEELLLLKDLYIILVINIAIMLLTNSLTGVIISREKFGFIKLLDIISFCFRTVLIVVLLRMGFGVIAIVMIDTTLNLLSGLAKLTYVVMRIDIRWKFGWDQDLLKQILTYGAFISLGVIVNQINWRADPFILGAVVGSESVAIYNIGLQFVLAYIAVAAAITNVFLPKFVRLVEGGASTELLTENLVRIGRYQFIMLGFFMVTYAALGYELIRMLFGDGFHLAFISSVIVMVPFTIVLIQGAANCILQAMNRHKVKSVILVAFAVMNVSLSIYLAELYGVVGVAVGTAISIVLGDILVMGVYLQRYIGLNMLDFYRKCSGIFLVIALVVGLFYWLRPEIDNWWLFCTCAILLNLVYSVLVWAFVLTTDDKRYFQGLISVVYKRFCF